ncbi:MAG: PAS domain-containing protein [Bacteroidota bacterium]
MNDFLKTRFILNSIQGKLIIFFAVAIIGLFSIIASTFYYASSAQENHSILTKRDFDLLNHLRHTNSIANKTLIAILLDDNSDELSIQKFWLFDLGEVLGSIEEVRVNDRGNLPNRELSKLRLDLEKIKVILSENGLTASDVDFESLKRISFEITPLIRSVNNSSNEIQTLIKEDISMRNEALESTLGGVIRTGIAFGLITVATLSFVFFSNRKAIRKTFSTLESTTSELKSGNIPENSSGLNHEVQKISSNFNDFFDMLHSVEEFAGEVGKGNFDNDIAVFDGKGDLGESLTNMKNSLQKVAQEDKNRNWVNQGFAQFGDILRSNHDDLTQLSDEVLLSMVRYLNAHMGAIYLKDTDDSSSDTKGKLIARACYAFEKKKKLNTEILYGEGLVGAVWQERDTVFLTDIPDNYIQVRSGLGEALPKCILLQPLQNNEDFVGVLEIASFQTFQAFEIDFVKKISETIASTVISVFNNERTKVLLEDSRQMGEEMKAQEEELRQNMEELEATQEEMRRTMGNLEKKEATLSAVLDNSKDTFLVLNHKYEVVILNKALREIFMASGIEAEIGDNILSVFPDADLEKWKDRYDRALRGEMFTEIDLEQSDGDTRHYEALHYPIRDEHGEIFGCAVVGHDFTAHVKDQEKLQQKQSTVESIINNSDDTYFAIDTDYKITLVNKTLKDKYKVLGVNLDVGTSILDVLPEESRDHWKARYDRALQGEQFTMEEDRSKNGVLSIIETHHNPIKSDEGTVIGCSVISKNVTHFHEARIDMEKKSSVLNSLIDNTDDTYFALDTDYKITIANKALRDRFEKSGTSLDPGDYIFDKLPSEAHAFWKEKYDRALKGESFSFTQERPVEDKVLFIRVDANPVKSNGEIIGASVMSRDVTEWKKATERNEELLSELKKFESKN